MGRVEVLSACLAKSRHRGIAGVCMWSPKYGAHIDAPKPGMFAGSEAQKQLQARNFESLFFGKRADATCGTFPNKVWMASKLIKLRCRLRKDSSPQERMRQSKAHTRVTPAPTVRDISNGEGGGDSNGRCPTGGGGCVDGGAKTTSHYGPATAVDDDSQVAGIDPLKPQQVRPHSQATGGLWDVWGF